MAQTLLIPLDGSEFSASILKQVIKLFKPADSDIMLLRVAALPESLTYQETEPLVRSTYDLDWNRVRDELPHELPQDRSIELERLWSGLREEMLMELRGAEQRLTRAGFKVSLRVRFGEAAAEIVALAETEEVSLIAMSTHGRTGLGRVLMGSVAAAVLQQLNLPVLMLHPAREVAEETLPYVRGIPVRSF